jgi:hypothetical protein
MTCNPTAVRAIYINNRKLAAIVTMPYRMASAEKKKKKENGINNLKCSFPN